MELLGENIEEKFRKCEKAKRSEEGQENHYRDEASIEKYHFSLKTVLQITLQILTRIEYIHSRRIIHRDIKPENFSMGKGDDKHKLYAIDFGLAKRFMSSAGIHIKKKSGKSLIGTARYVSLNTHRGFS